MKNKLNLILAALVAGIVTTAYATCYLQGVQVAKAPGEIVASSSCVQTIGCASDTTQVCCDFTADYYADEYAYKYDLYSVTAGGRHSAATASWPNYCDGAQFSGWWTQDAPGIGGNGFQVYYINASFSHVTAFNGPGGRAFYQPTCYYLDTTATSCN